MFLIRPFFLYRHLLLILRSLKGYIHELALRILIQYVYGWELMSCWSILVKRSATSYISSLLLSSGQNHQFFCNILVQATALLRKNLDNAKASLEVLLADLQFLRDQVTITQVLNLHKLVK